MTLHLIMTCHVIIFCFLLVPAHAFLFATFKWQTALIHSRQSELLLDDVRSSLSVYTLLRMAGGWGKRKKELTPEESARGDGVSGERRGFDAYELQESSDFMNRIRAEQKRFLKKKEEDFLQIAKMAGITDQAGDGVEPMGAFSTGDEEDDDSFILDQNRSLDIDVSVRWEEDEDSEKRLIKNLPDEVVYNPDESITRLDGDLDVRGATGKW